MISKVQFALLKGQHRHGSAGMAAQAERQPSVLGKQTARLFHPQRTCQREDNEVGVDKQVGERREHSKQPRPIAGHQGHLQCHRAQQRHKGHLAEGVDVSDVVFAAGG